MVEENNAHHNKEEKKSVFSIVVDIVVQNLQRPSEGDIEAISRALSESLDDMIEDVKIPPFVDREEFIEYFIAHQKALAEKGSSRVVRDIAPLNVEGVAAAKSSICTLEYTRADGSFCSNEECCKKFCSRFYCGMVVARFPCSPHPYHGDCFVHLLHESSLHS